MPSAKMAVRGVLGLSLALLGCIPLGGSLSSTPPAPRAAAPDTHAGTDIPLVPLPPPPTRKTARSDIGTPGTPAPANPPGAPVPPAVTASRLYQQAAASYGGIDSYIARLTRREVIKDKAHPEELLLFKFRKAPWSVYFKWLGKEGQGREVVFVKGQYQDKIHSLLAAGDVPFLPAGKRMAVAPDSVFVRSCSRHSITEAGIGASIDRLGTVLAALQRGDRRQGTLNVLPALLRPEFAVPVSALEHVIPAGAEAPLPRGGKRLYCFDPDNHLPVLVQTRDENGREVEYYRYDRLQYPVRLDADDFNPDKLWSRPQVGGAGTAVR
jgi:hypothetical protein